MPKKKVEKKKKRKKEKKKEKEEFQRLEGFDSPIFYSLISRLSHSWLHSTLSTLSTFPLNSLYFLHNTLYNTFTLPCHVPFGKLDLCCLYLFTSNLQSSLPFDLEVPRTSKLYNETVSR